MANLGQKNGIYHIRFRFQGKEYKKSLKTNDADSAAAAKSSVELTIHRLITALIVLPTGIDPGDFILSGGTLQQSRKAPRKQNLPSTNQLICEHLESQKKSLADSSHSTLAMHFRHLTRNLGDKAEAPCDRLLDQLSHLAQAGSSRPPRLTLPQFAQKYFNVTLREDHVLQQLITSVPPSTLHTHPELIAEASGLLLVLFHHFFHFGSRSIALSWGQIAFAQY